MYDSRILPICQQEIHVLQEEIFLRTVRKRNADRQRAVPRGECALCGGELYAGSACWRVWGRTLCEECLIPWLLAELEPYRTRWEEAEL